MAPTSTGRVLGSLLVLKEKAQFLCFACLSYLPPSLTLSPSLPLSFSLSFLPAGSKVVSDVEFVRAYAGPSAVARSSSNSAAFEIMCGIAGLLLVALVAAATSRWRYLMNIRHRGNMYASIDDTNKPHVQFKKAPHLQPLISSASLTSEAVATLNRPPPQPQQQSSEAPQGPLCSNCGVLLHRSGRYCSKCGKARSVASAV